MNCQCRRLFLQGLRDVVLVVAHIYSGNWSFKIVWLALGSSLSICEMTSKHLKKRYPWCLCFLLSPFLGRPLQSRSTTAKGRGWTRASIARGKRSRRSVTLSSPRWLGLTPTSNLPQTTSRIPSAALQCVFHLKKPSNRKNLVKTIIG